MALTLLTSTNLKQVGVAPTVAEAWVTPLNDTCAKYQINTILRRQHFLAQILHESGMLRLVVENLNYSEAGLLSYFGKYFNSSNVTGYAKQPIKIASRVYANRMGNGDEASQDGWKYKGRGAIQITGKEMYKLCGSSLKIDLIAQPQLLEAPQYAAESAGWFWDYKALNALADVNNILEITRRINGGENGLQNREALLAKLKSVI
jgi:putative chitinase